MVNKRPVPQGKREEQVSIFGQIVMAVGGACVVAALWLHSVVPIVIGTVGLFSIMSFMNGMGT